MRADFADEILKPENLAVWFIDAENAPKLMQNMENAGMRKT